MTKFAYLYETTENCNDVESIANRLGEQGWEMVSFQESPRTDSAYLHWTMMFKRPCGEGLR